MKHCVKWKAFQWRQNCRIRLQSISELSKGRLSEPLQVRLVVKVPRASLQNLRLLRTSAGSPSSSATSSAAAAVEMVDNSTDNSSDRRSMSRTRETDTPKNLRMTHVRSHADQAQNLDR
ncbi:hypothetical protein LSTR_LSTR015499 [Laodelphax striatellus]|uniref:Uncharacterized protein n=1 Tax=Laodelphax striatellus TaxID=195883 RepID=A0A482WHA3_LAOST|nr:hypothetical protein LSTR_LSTR015499 [Laodelphax striatellus]